MNKITSPSSSSTGGSGKNMMTALTLAAALTFGSPAFSQTPAAAGATKSVVTDKELDAQYCSVIKDLKKNNADVKSAADMYGAKSKDVVETLEPEVKYVVKTLIPKVFVDHLAIKTDLGSGLNKKTVLEWIYLNKGSVISDFSKELSARVWTFEKTNKYSNKAKYPVNYINDFAAYAKSDLEKKQLTLVETVFQESLEKIDVLFQTGKITVKFPLVAMYNKHFDEWATVVDAEGRSLQKYISGQPTKDDKTKSVSVTFDFNKFIAEEVKAGKSTDKFACIKKVCEEIINVGGIQAFKDQYELYIDEGSIDIQEK